MPRLNRSGSLLAALAVPILVAGGCSRKIAITQYPAFYTPQLRTVAVGPFQNATMDLLAGEAIAGRTVAALAANGTYRVLDQTAARAHENTDALLHSLRRRGDAQGLLTGTVTTYSVSRRIAKEPVYAHDKKGRKYVSHYIHKAAYDAVVGVTARLVRVADGTVLHATAPALAKVSTSDAAGAAGGKPPVDAAAALAAASDQAVAHIVEQLAVVRSRVSVGRDAFRTAHELRAGRWEGGRKYAPSDQRMFVVVELPATCDRNVFRIAITRRDASEILAEREFTWQREWSDGVGRGFEFSPHGLAQRAGEGEYVATLLTGYDPAIETSFRIETPKQEK